MPSYVNLSYRFFGKISRSVKGNFLDIREDLQRANIAYTLEEYLSTAFFTTALAFVLETISLSFIFGLIRFSVVSALLLSITLSLAISGVLFFLFYSYPAAAAKTRQSKIKKILPFAVSYMATISSSRLPPIVLFRTLAGFKEYGQIAEEAANVSRDVDVFGMTFSAAVKKQAKRSPSTEFRELLWGINSIIASGGDLTFYLKQKSEEMMNDYRRRIRKYAQDLSLFVEIYLTLIITGSIFFIVLSSIISAISGGLGTIFVQAFVVFILLPLLSIGFIIIIKSISPVE
ncbi:MAG: type II secretion system F family protein [Candidatus Aenigmarchaeota archaeon]|nr:type II secretion system F family protein [Candidatus Aenigmarchaeota archaeon]